MDFDDLINAIVCRPQIWNKSETNSNKHVKEKLWDEVSEELSATKDECRKKWKYLKDEYRKALRRSSTANKSRFKYYDQMNFMKEFLNGDGNVNNQTATGFDKKEKTRIMKKDHWIPRRVEIDFPEAEIKRLKPSEKDVDNPDESDLAFLKSLLPFFKDMDLVKKLTLRSDIQNLIVQALLEDDELLK